MVVAPTCRMLMVGVSLVLLAGCATGPRDGASHRDDEPYFARDIPGLPGGWDPMMSRVDNPILEARRIGSPSPALVRQALLAQHDRWMGTPYRLGGTSRHGIDCSALVQNVFAETFQLNLPRTTRKQVREGRRITRDELAPGDLVFFRPTGVYHHVGIYIGEGRFLHAASSRGVMISRLDNRYWRRHYWQARRTLEPTHLARRLLADVNA